MALADATKWFTRQDGEPVAGFVSGNDGVEAITQVYADLTPADPTRWNDLRVSLSAAKVTTNPPTWEAFRGNVQAWGFSPTSQENLYFEVQIPHGWVIGSEIRPHIHWSPGVSTNTGDVVWELTYSWANPNDAFPAPTAVTATQAAAGAYEHQLVSWTPIAGTGMRESSVLLCRLSRVATDAADTFTADAFALSVDIHYQADSLGSVDEIPAGA